MGLLAVRQYTFKDRGLYFSMCSGIYNIPHVITNIIYNISVGIQEYYWQNKHKQMIASESQ